MPRKPPADPDKIRVVGMTYERAFEIATNSIGARGKRGPIPADELDELDADITRLNKAGWTDEAIAGYVGRGASTIRRRRLDVLSLPSNTPTRNREKKK